MKSTTSQTKSQKILDLISETFNETLQQPALDQTIQSVKSALYDRDYTRAFLTQDYLDAYFVRWTPARALAYHDFFKSSPLILDKLIKGKDTCNILGIGAGAGAEVMAFGALSFLDDIKRPIQFAAVDIADWKACLQNIVESMNNKWKKPDIPTRYGVHLIHKTIFDAIFNIDLSKISIITSFFTMNELFSDSKAKTVKLLSSFSACSKGCLMIFLESAGSYSEIQVGTKKFPVHFLIQHTLTNQNHWKLLDSNDSKWFRLSEDLKYPLQLENMRYFYQIYERQ